MRGSMDGWYEDELECHGSCGYCDTCDNAACEAADEYNDCEDYE